MIRKQTLRNGVTVITETMPQVRSVTLGVWLMRGSRHEPKAVNGICHLIEHLVFKGTRTRTGREIALAMDSVGGQMDAFTSKEYTCFYAKVLDEHVPEAVELLADIVLNPRFDATELEREKKVILEEIRMVEDSPEELVYDLFSSHFYPEHPLGRPIQGTQATVAATGRRRLLAFFREVYCPANLLIVAAGNLRHDDLVRRVTSAFGALTPRNGKTRDTAPPEVQGGIVRRHKRELEQVHLLLGLRAYPESFEGRYPLFVLNALLGGTMSSRLFQKIREERGLAYTVYSAVNAFQDTGLLMVYAATSPKRAAEVVQLVLEEFVDLRDHGPKPAELTVAKEHLKGSLMLSLESTSSRMSNLARQEIYFGRQFSLTEVLRGVGGVEVDAVRDVARYLFSGQELALATVGRLDGFRLPRRAIRL